MADCAHENFRADVAVGRMLDSGKFIADITVQCAVCNLPFRFLGVSAGLLWDRPSVSIDGTELHAPIEPEDEKMLHTSAQYVMPEIPKKN